MKTSTSSTAHFSASSSLGPIFRLADQLDAALALGEDLLLQAFNIEPVAPGDGNAALLLRHQAFGYFARSVRALELALTARVLQARARAIEVRDVHPRFVPVIGLLIGGTAPLVDAAAGRDGGLGDISMHALSSGPDVLHFLVARRLVASTTPSLSQVAELACTDDYLLAGHIRLGTLLDMIAQVLESLDLAFDLYAEPRVATA